MKKQWQEVRETVFLGGAVPCTKKEQNELFRQWLEQQIAEPPLRSANIVALRSELEALTKSEEARFFGDYQLYLLERFLKKRGSARSPVILFRATVRAFCRMQINDCRGKSKEYYSTLLEQVNA